MRTAFSRLPLSNLVTFEMIMERRKMINVDIADDMFNPKDETKEGPKTFKSMRRRRGPLGEGWQDSKAALSITHQLVTIDLPAPNFVPQKMISLGERMIGKFVWRYYCQKSTLWY